MCGLKSIKLLTFDYYIDIPHMFRKFILTLCRTNDAHDRCIAKQETLVIRKASQLTSRFRKELIYT